MSISARSSLLVAALVLAPAGAAHAQVGAWCDTTTTAPALDGAIGAGEYAGFGGGVGNDFGAIIGAGAELYLDSGSTGSLFLALDSSGFNCTLQSGGTNYDEVVIYLDSIPGAGFTSTTGFTDNFDPGRAAITGLGTNSGRADLTFAPGFGADYAIVIDASGANLFLLQAGSPHLFIRALSRAPTTGFGTACIRELAGLSMKDLGSQPGNPVRFFATLINAYNAYRSTEFQGVATAPASAIGVNPYSLAAGDRNTFESDGPPVGFSGDFAWIDFGTFAGAGFSPAPTCGQLSSEGWITSGWSDGAIAFGSTATTGDFARGVNPGTTGTGGVYAFPVATNDNALGVRPIGSDFTPGDFTLRILNEGITTITSVDVSYRVWIRNDQPRGNTFAFATSTDGSSFTTVAGALVTSPDAADATPVWVATDRSTTVSGLEIPPGGLFYLRWTGDDATGSGSRDAFALDEIVARPTFSTCGNSTIDFGEACDNGATNGSTTCDCQWDCSLPAAGIACGGGGLGVCDLPDTCDGAGACADRFVASGTECNASTGPCDVAEACTGSSHTCPADGVATAGTVCLAADPAAPCDVDDVCDGSGVTCPSAVATSGTSCRASTGTCDLGASCDGAATACPASSPASSSTSCRASTGTCDLGASCDGATLTCPTSSPATSGTACRTSTGPCDLGASCNGAALTCPASSPATAGTACRPSTGTCDLGGSCSGTALSCPASTPAATTVVCRVVAGLCDVAENCDGTLTCPADSFMASGTECRAATGACDVAESCGGSSAMCPTDGAAADGTACSDGTTCNGAEVCASGACGTGTPIDCSDTDLCTADMCTEPSGACSNPAIAGCCNLAADCDDTDLCTTDTCTGPGGTCGHAAITGCCTSDTDCSDASACTADTCDTSSNTCVFAPIAGCCAIDTDCDDGNICTADTCGSGGACGNAAIAGCCLTDGDCDDSNSCTTDACGTDDLCASTAIADCCATDADCDDSDVCTTDSCDLGTERCAHTAACDDAGVGDAGVDDAGIDDAGVMGDASVGTDAGPRDAAVAFDAGVDGGAPVDDGGCSCRAGGRRSSGAPIALGVLVLGLAFFRRRRGARR